MTFICLSVIFLFSFVRCGHYHQLVHSCLGQETCIFSSNARDHSNILTVFNVSLHVYSCVALSFLKNLYWYHCRKNGGNGNPLQCFAWRIPGTAEPGGLPSMGSHRVGYD